MAIYQSQGPRGWNLSDVREMSLAKARQSFQREKELRMQETWQEYLSLKQENPNLTRGDLYRLNRVLYERMRRYGQLKNVPLQRRYNPWTAFDCQETLSRTLEVVQNQYPNHTRGQLHRETPAIYRILERGGALNKIRLLPVGYEEQDRHYRENYEGMTFFELERVDPDFTDDIQSKGLRKYLPRHHGKNGNGKHNGKINGEIK